LEIENRQSHKPRLIAFEVTRRCRFNCKHCRANAGVSGNEKELTTEQCKRILAAVAEFYERLSAEDTEHAEKELKLSSATSANSAVKGFDKCVIILTGGEPMERSDIYELIRYGRDLGMRMVMATCGYPINDESIAGLKEAGILALSISLDGASAQTHDAFRQSVGAFDSAVKAAEAAGRAGMRFQINTTITKSNVTEVLRIAELAEKFGAYCFDAFILVPTGRAEGIAEEILEPGEYEKLLHNLLRIKLESDIEVRVTCGPEFARVCRQAKVKKLIGSVSGCMGGRGFGFISYRGDVQTCGFLDISAGNLIENGFDFGRIWLGSEFLKEIRDLSAYKGNCGICEYVGVCGGCRARAYAMSGDYLAADPICNYK